MRKADVLILGFVFGVFFLLFMTGADIPFVVVAGSFGAFFFTFLGSFDMVNYYAHLIFGISRWINPILKLSILLIKLDGVEKIGETKRMVAYLNNELDPLGVKVKLIYYKKRLNKKYSVSSLCETIAIKASTSDKIRILQHLIKIALSDRLLEEKEKKFIQLVAKRLKIPGTTLNAIFNLHTYVTEEDIKNQRNYKPRTNYGLQKAFAILGLESTATEKEVKEAYRELAKVYHPDKQRGNKKSKDIAKAQFQIVTNAYEIIKKKLG